MSPAIVFILVTIVVAPVGAIFGVIFLRAAISLFNVLFVSAADKVKEEGNELRYYMVGPVEEPTFFAAWCFLSIYSIVTNIFWFFATPMVTYSLGIAPTTNSPNWSLLCMVVAVNLVVGSKALA